jgi:HEAT repeat protein
MLGALGNSAGPTVIPVIEQALRDMHAPIRAAAARALRLAPGAEVDRTLASVVTSDSEPGVRADAIFAARFRRPLAAPLADALLHAAASDKADYVRSDAVSVLRQNPTASVRIPETLGRVAKLDVDPGIRRQAREALAAFSTTTHP